MQILLVSDGNFLTASTQSIAAHRQAVEKIRYLHILKLQHHAAKLTSIAHLLQQRWRCFARSLAIANRKQRRKMLLKTS
ncbi:hypothetical protein [Nostoc sphaeroides]|uniref:Uncharacterized protein n=1 Tax=Nostoc sphaeroides CCNUC1 TaxID=2653204 RepID=A0A5P8WF70_9NOSO|nr:hypothetical protein [Nostoc sphaeroides]QFS51477.1 hypothetical protein GXM_08971 [Nostoc sphaeroides CCNUC1]